MIVRFTIPVKFDAKTHFHPVSPDITPDDWFEVQADSEAAARKYVIEVFGNGCFMSTYVVGNRHDDREWMEGIRYHNGECKKTIDLWKTTEVQS